MADLVRAIWTYDKKRVVLPKFVIYEPDKAPILSGKITAKQTRQVNELHSTVDDLIEHLSFFRSAKNKTSANTGATTTNPLDIKPSYSVILKQLPKGLKKSKNHKEHLDGLAGDCCTHTVSLRPLRKEWPEMLDDKYAANSLAEALNCATDTDARLKTPTHCGIIRQIPHDVL